MTVNFLEMIRPEPNQAQTIVDQLLIVVSAAEPTLKPNLIDRFLITAEKADITAVICINKIDLVDPADLQPLIGVYGQMGYHVQLVSAETGFGIPPGANPSLQQHLCAEGGFIAG